MKTEIKILDRYMGYKLPQVFDVWSDDENFKKEMTVIAYCPDFDYPFITVDKNERVDNYRYAEVIPYEVPQEIWEMLPKWADNYITMDERGRWYSHENEPVKVMNFWETNGYVQPIPEELAPKDYKGDWTQAFFKNPLKKNRK